ncbi:EF-hand calcium-binding domain-containing protein 12 [Psammomys obesus]|uniref:EF-hand calcium-binding domain-containing protein 12 n=1 Tax=Psammomys obesus TaxID=48139 RepID=UPI0024530146|nr:EF-hand calcium-binding domain-containing protein 12 [Psammomys obesus]
MQIMIGVPLKNQELEDIVIYLSTLGKQNAITTDAILSTYKQWAQTQQRETVPIAREYYRLYIKKTSVKHISDKQDVSYPQTPKMDLLKVPEVDTKMEGRPMTEEDMEDVGRRYRERRRKNKLCLPSIQYMERCRLVRSGVKAFDEHCLPSTLSGEMEELINVNRRNDFLIYLKCWEVCKAYKLPLTEDILMRALLYPGDKLITMKHEVRPIRQPGGYYIDQRLGCSMAEFGDRCHQNLGERKTDKKTTEKLKKMNFQEFQEFTWNLEEKGRSSLSGPHPNNFWPGHLLDKLRLYLPSVAKDKSLAIFNFVEHGYHGHAYPASYQPRDWWPMRDNSYVTYAYHDAHKVYFLN